MEQKHVLTDDNIKLSYTVSKNLNQKPYLVFLHGAGSNHTIWHAIIKDLSQYNMILPDCRGHGNSASGKLGAMIATALFSLERILSTSVIDSTTCFAF